MKIKELKLKLNKFDDDADVIVVFDNKFSRQIEIYENPELKDNKLIDNKKLILIDGGGKR